MPPEHPNSNEVVRVAQLCAQLILENGGETYRAEETACRVCKALGFDETEAIALPTGLYLTVSRDGSDKNTSVKRIRKRGVNLRMIEAVNSIARQLTAGKLSVCDSLRELSALCAQKPRRIWISVLAAGLSSGCFALLFQGSVFDFAAATLCGILVQLAAGFIKTEDMFNITLSILGGFLVGTGSVLWVKLTGTGNLDKIITGAMMPLLPGIPMTNAIRDTMRGDLVSGVARGAEALLTAAALAFGVGVVLKLYLQFLR